MIEHPLEAKKKKRDNNSKEKKIYKIDYIDLT